MTRAYRYGTKLALSRAEVEKYFDAEWEQLSDEEKAYYLKTCDEIYSAPTAAERAHAKALLDRAPVPVRYHEAMMTSGGGAFVPSLEAVYFSSKGKEQPALVAHELGHATFHKTPLGRVTQSDMALRGLSVGSALAPLSGFLAPPGAASAVVPLVHTAVAHGPSYYSEHEAWRRGRKDFHALSPTEEEKLRFEAVRDSALKTYRSAAVTTLVRALIGAGVRAGYDHLVK